MQDLYTANYKMLVEEIKRPNKWRTYHVHGLEYNIGSKFSPDEL